MIFSVFTAIQRADLTGDVTTFGYFGGLLMAGGTPKSSILVGDFPFETSYCGSIGTDPGLMRRNMAVKIKSPELENPHFL